MGGKSMCVINERREKKKKEKKREGEVNKMSKNSQHYIDPK
jgi:hypothetical protein